MESELRSGGKRVCSPFVPMECYMPKVESGMETDIKYERSERATVGIVIVIIDIVAIIIAIAILCTIKF